LASVRAVTPATYIYSGFGDNENGKVCIPNIRCRSSNLRCVTEGSGGYEGTTALGFSLEVINPPVCPNYNTLYEQIEIYHTNPVRSIMGEHSGTSKKQTCAKTIWNSI
jgi:hypothetical protein